MENKHLTRDQRYTIEALLQTPMSLKEIGQVIWLNNGTASRELANKTESEQLYKFYNRNSIIIGWFIHVASEEP